MGSGEAVDAGSVRRCLLGLGAAMLAGGRTVHDVEDDLRRVGRALGLPDVQIAATPTGLFISLGLDRSTAFEQVGRPLRFDQLAQISTLPAALIAGRESPDGALRALAAAMMAPARIPGWLAAAALVPVGVGIALILQPALPNVLAAAVGAVIVAVLTTLAVRWALLQTLLPIVAAFVVAALILLAADASLLEGPLRTMLGPLAVLLPGALLVTGMSELASGAMVAGASRLIFGTVQLLLFALGVVAAARVVNAPNASLANLRVDELGAWAPWVGVLLVGVGVYLNLSAPRGALPWMWLVLLVTFAAQLAGQSLYGAAGGGLLGGAVAALVAAVVQRLPTGPPSLVVFLPAFWLLVPGSLGLLGTTQLAIDSGGGTNIGVGTVEVVMAIALGILIGSALGRAVDRFAEARRHHR